MANYGRKQHNLSPREREVLEMRVAGVSIPAIAAHFGITNGAVTEYCRRAMVKTKTETWRRAAIVAGIIGDDA